MEPDRKKLGEDIQKQIEKLYLLIDCVEMLPKTKESAIMGIRTHFGLGAMALTDLVER